MKSKKYKKKIISKYIIIIFFMILFLTGTLIIFYFNSEEKQAQDKLSYINSNEWNNEIYPDGMPKFFRYYKGELTAQNIGKSIYYISNEVIPEYYIELNKFSEEKIKEYYQKNQETIYLDIGKISEKEFLLLINEINKLKDENLKFERYYIDKDSIRVENESTKANLYIKYYDHEEISIVIEVFNNKNIKHSSIEYYK